MEAEVIDHPDKSVGQQANGCHRNRLWKRGHEEIVVHIVVGHRHACMHNRCQEFIYGVEASRRGTEIPRRKRMEMNCFPLFLILFYFPHESTTSAVSTLLSAMQRPSHY
jgi:hypothetical protein